MDEETAVFKKAEPCGQSKIFNTSIRGWIALILAACLCVAMVLIVIAPYCEVQIPDTITNQIVALFATGFGSAVTQYFNQKSREGQSTT